MKRGITADPGAGRHPDPGAGRHQVFSEGVLARVSPVRDSAPVRVKESGMLLPLAVHELVDVVKRRTGMTSAELAQRMGWRPGTLDSFLYRLRAGKEPTRSELDALARGLSDDRFELTARTVLRNYLYAAAGIEPTPEEVAELLATTFPHAPTDPHPCYVRDTRRFFRWVNPALVALAARLGGRSREELTLLAHGWTLGQRDAGGASAPVAEQAARVPEVFRLHPDLVTGAHVRRSALHSAEVIADDDLGINAMFGAREGRAFPEGAVLLLEEELRLIRLMWPDFRSSRWYAPIDRRLARFPGYRRAIRRASARPTRAAPVPCSTPSSASRPRRARSSSSTPNPCSTAGWASPGSCRRALPSGRSGVRSPDPVVGATRTR